MSDALTDAVRTFASVESELHRFGPVSLTAQGPPEAPRLVASAVDEVSNVEFVLVDGGRLTPGPGDDSWAKLSEFSARIHAPPNPYGSSMGAHWARVISVECEVEPFLIARFPVSSRLHDLDSILSEDRFHRNARAEALRNPRRYLPLLEREVEAANARFGWDTPSAVQLEWAISGGARTVYYWGDQLVADLGEQGPRHPLLRLDDFDAAWPAAGPFGLVGGVAIPQWCWLPVRYERVAWVRGGAGYCAPWQDCGEFLWLVNFMIAAASSFEEFQTTHGYRPIIALSEDAQTRELERLEDVARKVAARGNTPI